MGTVLIPTSFSMPDVTKLCSAENAELSQRGVQQAQQPAGSNDLPFSVVSRSWTSATWKVKVKYICMSTYVAMYLMYVCVDVYVRMCVFVYVYVCIHVYVFMCICVYVYMRICVICVYV